MRVALLITIAFFILSLSPTYAAVGFEVEDNSAKLDFPNTVRFHLWIKNKAIINLIELEYGTTQVTCGSATAKVKPDFEPATQVVTSWTWDFRKSDVPPPGAQLWWRWRIKDKAGNELITDKQELLLNDSNHKWQEINSDELTLFSAVADKTVNQALWQTATKTLDKLENKVGVRPERVIKIYNYPNTESLREARIYSQEWMGGLAIPTYDTVLLGVNRQNLDWGEQSMAHELTHLITYQITFNCLGNIPVWLNEGLATYIEGDLGDDRQETLAEAVADDELISLQSLSSSFPTNSNRADLAYIQSRQVVDYLLETYGMEKMTELLQTFKKGVTSDEALQQVYGLDTQHLDNAWRVSLGLSTRQIMVTSTPILPPTLVPYGANSPTAVVTPTTTTPTKTKTITSSATLTPPTPTPHPTPTPILPSSMLEANSAVLIGSISGGVIITILIIVAIFMRRRR